ncbi:MAG: FAD-dependent oxidoreductase [Aliidongia sp.]
MSVRLPETLTMGHGAARRPSLGIIGSGIAGLGVAYQLRHEFEITVFERDTQLGGHIRPVRILDSDGISHEIDTGFLFYQPAYYPEICRLFDELGVPNGGLAAEPALAIWDPQQNLLSKPSEFFQFSKGAPAGEVTADLRRLTRLFATLNHNPTLLHGSPLTAGQYFEEQGYHPRTVECFIVPILAVIWGFQDHQVRAMSVGSLFGELRRLTSAPWRVKPTSRQYLDALVGSLESVRLLPGRSVGTIEQVDDRVKIVCEGEIFDFDYVVVAAHADCALKLLGDRDRHRFAPLEALHYNHGIGIVHSDRRVLPPVGTDSPFTLTWLARTPTPHWLVTWDLDDDGERGGAQRLLISFGDATLLEEGSIDEARIYRVLPSGHPSLTPQFVSAQTILDQLNHGPRLFLSGSYFGHLGNHEDAYRSALVVSERIRRSHLNRAAWRP